MMSELFSPRRTRAARVGALVVLLLAATLSLVPAPATAADPDPVLVEVRGRGWGHGRGLGQYGAQGYALDQGRDSAWILDRFYGGTTAGQVPGNSPVDPSGIRVELRGQRGDALTVGVASGTITASTPRGEPLRARMEGAVRLSSVNGGVRLETADSCTATEWTERFTSGHVVVDLVSTSGDAGRGGRLRVCADDGSSIWYPGKLRFHADLVRTVNVTTVENYLRGVVPAEVPASWQSAALEAQAVAARSYALAGDTRQQPYADTCDTTLCQVYRGWFRQSSKGEAVGRSTHPATDAAIAATAGLVRIRDGRIARTEFSSSTGGYTAGGAFPAVLDEGDATPSNPNRSWVRTVDLRSFIDAQGKGELIDIVTEGNGLGPDGGRAVSVTFVFENGKTVLSGNATRRQFGFKSDWFRFGSVKVGDAALGRYVDAVYQLFLQRDPTSAERNEWVLALGDGVSRQRLTEGLAASDEWAGVMIDDLYQTVFGRPSDAGGRRYWLGRMARGLRFERVAANFYGAPEYYVRAGGTDEAFVAALYTDILGRAADESGLEYWSGRLGAGRLLPGQAAAGFYASVESRQDRVTQLYDQVLGRRPDAMGLAYWVGQLLVTDDVSLAAKLASSQEFLVASQGGG